MQPASSIYQFGRFHLDSAERRLLRDGQAVPLTPKAFDTLLTLVQHSGHALTKDELMRAVWPDGFVEEVNLAYNISILRKALADGQPDTSYIETVPKVGYRFVVPVQKTDKRASLQEARTNLPAQLTRFIGRHDEVVELVVHVKTMRLLTLTGAGGVGKSRLALEVAARLVGVTESVAPTTNDFPDGVWLVEFAPIADAELVTQVVAAALDVTEQPGATLLDLLIARLRNLQALLVFDNCEHLIAACASLAERLLRAGPELHILATSREPLRIEGEVTWRVPSLTDEEAVQLFVERARANQPQFEATARNAIAIAQICHRLDGIPLAIELAAARVNTLTVEQIAARLDDRFELLTTGSRTVLARHQTLRAAIAWSLDLLTAQERDLLVQLAVFAGGFTADAAGAMCDRPDVLDLLSNLVDKSLVIADVRGEVARYRMLETIRQFALEHLRETGQEVAARDRHLAYMLTLAEAAEIGLRGEQLQDWCAKLEQDLDNLRAALAWSHEAGTIETGLRLVGASWLFWCVQEHAREGLAWAERFLDSDLSTRAPSSIRAKALYGATMMAWRIHEGSSPQMLTHAQNGLMLSRASKDDVGVALSLTYLEFNAQAELDYQRAQGVLEHALNLLQGAHHLWGVGLVKSLLGRLLILHGKFAQGEADLADSLPRFGRLDWWFLYHALSFLIAAALAQGDIDRAKALAQQRLTLGQESSRIRMRCRALRELGNIAVAEGDYRSAAESFEACIALFRKSGDVEPSVTHALVDLGLVSHLQGDHETARQRLNEALAFFEDVGNTFSICHVQLFLGYAVLAQGGLLSARRHFTEGINVASHEVGHIEGVAIGLAGIGCVLQARGNVRRATKLFGFAAKFNMRLKTQWLPAELADYERIVAQAQAQLDNPELAAAWAEGQAMTLDEAVAFALARE